MKILLWCLCVTAFTTVCQRDFSPTAPTSYVWPSASPESQGCDHQQLQSAFEEADERGFINAIVITRNGYLVAERYFNGCHPNQPQQVHSVSKSILSALVGIALREGHISNLGTPVVDYFPEYSASIRDDRINSITLYHLLTMKTGFASDTHSYMDIFYSANWILTTFEQPLLFAPGSSFRYNTGGTHMLAGALTRATSQDLKHFAIKHLFDPLGIHVGQWKRDPQGNYCGGNHMFFTPRDMARFGWLYMNEGALEGKQIVPQEWVRESLRVHYKSTSEGWGELEDIGYGYLWWLGTLKSRPVFLALGHGGQFILCVPELNMVITVCSDSANRDWDWADQQERSVLDVVGNFIFPGIK